jgi:hypothetical protein
MNMKKFFPFASLSKKFVLLAGRMPVSILLVVGLAALLFVEVNARGDVVPYRWWVFCPVALFISVAAALWLEDHVKNGWTRHGLAAGCAASWGAYCLLLPRAIGVLYLADWLPTIVIGVVSFCAIFFISFLSKNKDLAFWQFVVETLSQVVIGACFAGILLGGLCLAAVSIQTLFGVYMDDTVYGNLAIFCMALFFPLYALANIPGREEKHNPEINLSKVLKIMGLYILVPLLVLYTVILYAYLARIVVAWELPNGWVSTLVSTLALGGLLVIAIIYPMRVVENRWARWFSRHAGLVMLPLLVLMTVGIGRRVGDYGITINRCYVLLLNAWFYGIYIYLYFSRARHIKWVLITPVALVLLASVGPWRFSSVTKRALLDRVEVILDGNLLSLTGSAARLEEMEQEKREELREALAYLSDNYGNGSIQPLFEESIESKSMYSVFAELNLQRTFAEYDGRWFSLSGTPGSSPLDIKGYASCIVFSYSQYGDDDDPNIEIRLDSTRLHARVIAANRSASFPIKEAAVKQIDRLDRTNSAILLEALDGEEGLLVITEMAGTYYTKKDSLAINNMTGILFYK